MNEIIIAIIASGALSTLIAGIFNLINNHRSKQERDILRTQLLVMIKDFPKEHTEILKLAQHYFVDLKGNWVMTGIFNTWLEQENIGKPEWYKF